MKIYLTHQSSPRSLRRRIGFTFLFLLAAVTSQAAPFGTEFTYQGRLDGAAGPANGRYDFTFGLHLAASGGTAIVTVTNSSVSVSNGLFTTAVNFGGGIFNGNAYWVQLGVRSNGTAAAFTALSPRQPLTPTPNAHYATLAGTVPGGSITSSKLGVDSVTTSALQNNAVTGAKIANGQVVRSLNGLQDAVLLAAGANTTLITNGNTLTLASSSDWKIGGNAGTTPPANFLGTTDNQPLVLKVNGTTALRIDPTATTPNIIGGLGAIIPTVVGANVRGAVVAGGNAPAGPVTGLGGGDFHAVFDSDGAIGGGFGNKVGTDNGNPNDAPFATVAGGVFNWAANYASTVAGGDGNYVAGSRAAIGGGYGNQAYSTVSVIAGGQANVVQTNSPNATIGGGQNNLISPGGVGYVSAKGATIGGGEGNTVFGLGGFPEVPLHNDYGTIGGGYSNTVNGSYGTVPGGYFNTASGDFSFAAGSRAAAGYGCFVWADASSTSPFSSTANNQFSIRAAGGVSISHDVLMNSGRTIFSSGRLHIQANENLYLNPFAGAGDVIVGGGGGPGNLVTIGSASVCSLTIRGGCDLAEPFKMSSKEISKGAVVVIDPKNPGHLKMSARAYDKCVAGIVSGANGVNPGITLRQEGLLEGDQNVALSGRVYVQADANGGPIEPGDLLTTSDTPGHAMRANDTARAQGAILGKAMSSLTEGKGMVLVLVTLQ